MTYEFKAKVLNINLSTRKTAIQSIPTEIINLYLGGRG